MAAAVVALGLALAGCGAGPAPSATVVDVAGTPTPRPTAAVAATPVPTQAARGTAGALVVDPALLAVLPAQVAGVAMLPAVDAAAGMITDPALGLSASGLAVGIVVAPGTSGDDDLATSTVVQLRPGVGGDAFYEAWRRDYDQSACAPAGGVASHAQQRIGAHDVEVTVCGGGARLYHTRLPGDRLVSITAVGDRRFGDLVMAGLRE